MIPLLHPLVLALLALLAGLLPALRSTPDPVPWLLAAPVAVGVAVLVDRRSASAGWVLHALLLAAFAAAGAGLGAVAGAQARGHCLRRLPDGAEVRVSGRLAAGTRADAPGGLAPPLPLDGAVLEHAGRSCRGSVRVRLATGALAAGAGTGVVVRGEWVAWAPAGSRERWPRRPGSAGMVAVDSVERVVAPAPLRHPLAALRGRSEASIRRLFERHAALAEALFLGRREWVDPAVRDRFARSGLVHLLAISGAHVGLLAGILLLLGAVARLPRRRVVIVALGVLALYLAMIGAPPSAVRAGVMIALALAARLMQRPSATAPMIACAALLLLARDPLAALDPGVQLSFAGVGGILIAIHAVRPRLPARWTEGPARRWVVESLLVSAAAFAATAPIAAHHFGLVAPVSVLASLPAAPLLALALAGVLGATALEPILPPLARLFADGATLAFELLDRVALAAGSVPLGHAWVPRPQWGRWLAAAAAAAVAAALVSGLRPAVRRGVAVGCAAALLLAWPALTPAAGGALEVHFLDVGQGDATAIRTPRGRWLLVDAGPSSPRFDAGERRVLPFLRAHGARRIEALLLTHPDLDHIGGAPAVVKGIPVARVIEPGLPVGKPHYLALLDAVEQRGVAWSAARSGRALEIDGLRIELLWPDSIPLDPALEANQISAVARLRYGEFVLLLTGDAPAEVERLLVARHPDRLAARVLKAGHHGSATSTTAELLAAVRPELVVISAGRRNRYGHPHPDVLDRLRGGGIELARTDREGIVALRVDGRGGRWSRIQP